MTAYEITKARWTEELSLSPSKRTQNVPCAFCVRGGNGDADCAAGMHQKKYSKFHGCFSGAFLEKDPMTNR